MNPVVNKKSAKSKSMGLRWRYKLKQKNKAENQNGKFKEVKQNGAAGHDKSGLISFNMDLQLETDKEKEEFNPKMVLNLEEEAKNGYIETEERTTDREASRFSLEFSRSDALAFEGNTNKLSIDDNSGANGDQLDVPKISVLEGLEGLDEEEDEDEDEY